LLHHGFALLVLLDSLRIEALDAPSQAASPEPEEEPDPSQRARRLRRANLGT
jgi:hypothetical protein